MKELLSKVTIEKEGNIGREKEEGILLDVTDQAVGRAPWLIEYLSVQKLLKEET